MDLARESRTRPVIYTLDFMVRIPNWIKWTLKFVGASVALLSAIITLLYWYMHFGVFGTDSFDTAAWNAPAPSVIDEPCYRGGMAKDIRDNVLSRKMTSESVLHTLGKPDGMVTAREYRYILGMCSGMGIDYDILHVFFDETGHFSSAKIVQH